MSQKNILAALLLAIGAGIPFMAGAAEHNKLRLPAKGVVCDAYFCADAAGISDLMTTKYLGAKKGQHLAAQGEFNRTTFTFANGIYCDTKEKVCRKDRYFGADGKPSGKIDSKTTQWLFAQ
ncbi:YcgJ family protein [Enterobacter asburiae]|uniref:YcgJ family protein n=1 Tax=Enterobacter asburiae TaxID=61645 RepID=UPI003F562633